MRGGRGRGGGGGGGGGQDEGQISRNPLLSTLLPILLLFTHGLALSAHLCSLSFFLDVASSMLLFCNVKYTSASEFFLVCDSSKWVTYPWKLTLEQWRLTLEQWRLTLEQWRLTQEQ